MPPPADNGCFRIVVTRIVIHRHMDGKSLVFIPEILLFQGIGIIFRVAGDEDLPSFLTHDSVNPCFRRGGENLQPGHLFNIHPVNGSVPGMGHPKLVVKAPEQNGPLIVQVMGINAEKLLGQGMLLNPIVVVQPCLGAPADMEGGMDIGLAPGHDPAQLRPVVHFLKGHLLHRRSGDDHAIKLPVLQFIKGFVEGQKMLLGGIF